MIGMLSAGASLLVVFLNYTSFENFPGIVRLCALVISGFAIGIGQGLFIGRPWHGAIGIGAFVGLLIGWVPVVMVTYGFALLGLPLLAIFATLVFLGAKFGAHLSGNGRNIN